MENIFWKFFANEDGQDLVEYTLVLAMITLGAVGIMSKAGASTKTIWTAASTTLSTAVTKSS